ncbi:MAG: hypothetical protein U0Z53_23915 [Blastocatellia bacterium]
MKKKINFLLLIGILFLPAIVFPDPCGKTGMTALRANDGKGFLFYLFREKPDLYFALPGREISFPSGTSGPKRFLIDGILYETLLVKTTEFIKAEKGLTDLDILKKYQAYEFAYLQKTPTPLQKLVELGPREKAGGKEQPKFTFYLWEVTDPKNEDGPRQYFLTTISSGEVVVLTAVVREQSSEDTAMQAFESYARSFQHVLKKEQCPQK